MTEKITPQVEMSLESAEHARDRALERIKDFQKEREGAIARGDEAAALRLSSEIDKAKVKAEIEELKVKHAQARLKQVNADKPKADKVLGELQDLWSQYKQAIIEVLDLHRTATEKAAKITGLAGTLRSKAGEYERLTLEHGSVPPIVLNSLNYLPNLGVSVRIQDSDLEWKTLTSQQMQQSAPIGEPDQDLQRQMRRYR